MKVLSRSRTTYFVYATVSLYVLYLQAIKSSCVYLIHGHIHYPIVLGDNEVRVEGEIAEAHPRQFWRFGGTLEGKMKMKVKGMLNYDDPIIIEFSKTFTELPKSFLRFPTAHIRGNFDHL